MNHKNYYKIDAKTYYEAGYLTGELFGDELLEAIEELKRDNSWKDNPDRSQKCIGITARTLPHLIDELRGYSDGAGMVFEDVWLCIEGETCESDAEKCTTIITNSGQLIAHNEDWDAEAKDNICVLRRTIGDLTILELFYFNTLGGNAISINSNGYVQTINTLTHSDKQIGIPKNIIARWLSETIEPKKDFIRLSMMQRASGYNHNLINKDGMVWNIECGAKDQILITPELPFIHTNHYLSDLKKLDNANNNNGTFSRFNLAESGIEKTMLLLEIQKLMSDSSNGRKKSLFNEMTIARMIVDFEKMKAFIWLLREDEKGWVEYGLDFINI